MLQEIIKFETSREWLQFEQYFNTSSFIDQVDLVHVEDANTSFLASLLKENNVYDLGLYPMKLFLKLIASKSGENHFKNVNLFGDYDLEFLKDDGIKVRKKLGEAGTPDLVIEFTIDKAKYIIVLEAKLLADETDDQCKRYKNAVDKLDYTDRIYLYLTLDGDIPNSVDSNSYIPITYQELLDNIYEPCCFKTNYKSFLNDYIKGFISLYNYDGIDAKLVPISYEGAQVTINLWNKNEHKKLIIDLLNNQDSPYLMEFYKSNKSIIDILFINLYNLAKQGKLDLDKDTKETLGKKIDKIIHRFEFDHKFYGKSDFLYEVFKSIISKHKIQSLDQLSNINTTTANWRNIIPSFEIANDPHKEWYRLNKTRPYQEPLKINNVEYYYCYNNNDKDIRKFIEAVIKFDPEYKDLIKEVGDCEN